MKDRLKYILDCQLADTEKASVLQPDGTYVKIDRRGKKSYNSQEAFCREAQMAAAREAEPKNPRVFIPESGNHE